MNISIFGTHYYLDEAAFKERMSQPPSPWRMDEIIEIQHRIRSFEEWMWDYLHTTATPDPMAQLRRHLDEMMGGKETK